MPRVSATRTLPAWKGSFQHSFLDIQLDRLELARELGATHLINGKDENLLQQIQDLCKPGKGVDYALDCSGVLGVIETMIQSLGMRGRATSAGASAPGQRVAVDVFLHLVSGREYVGCHQGGSVAAEMIPFLIEQHNQGKYPLDRLIRYYNVKDAQQAFQEMKAGKVLKPVLLWSESGLQN